MTDFKATHTSTGGGCIKKKKNTYVLVGSGPLSLLKIVFI